MRAGLCEEIRVGLNYCAGYDITLLHAETLLGLAYSKDMTLIFALELHSHLAAIAMDPFRKVFFR